MEATPHLHDPSTLSGFRDGKLSSCRQFTRVAMGEVSVPALVGKVLQLISGPADDEALRESIGEVIDSLSAGIPASDAEGMLIPALRLCEQLHGQAKSSLAVPLSEAIRDAAERSGVISLRRWSATACGVLLIDTGDTVGAIEWFVDALRLAVLEENRHRMAGLWNNIGNAFNAAASDEMAARCYMRALSLLEKDEDPVFQRFSVCSNLASSCYKLGRIEDGLAFGQRALLELTPEIRGIDQFRGVLLHRNLVRLYVATGRLEEARTHVDAATRIATGAAPRLRIAAEIAKAFYEGAVGQHDIALTRIDKAVADARFTPAALADALICAVRCEEAAGNVARALVRLGELGDHVYRSSVATAREQIRAAGLAGFHGEAREQQIELERAKLVSQLDAPRQPEGWKSLQRLGIKATMPVDGEGRHGTRVGALTRALAEACGHDPLQAREIGFAAEVHDIGMTAVPAAILSKAGSLNESEHRLVKRHVAAGAEMLAEGRHPRMLLAQDIAQFHHARYDGQGYPSRVGGDFIPVAARMCAIADAYDMMVCGFGGRAGRSMGEALEELRRNAGGQFDPKLVSCFEEVIRSEAGGLGMDLSSDHGMADFHDLVLSLKEDRGFV
jgi:putative two-component system response regulator